MHVRWSGALWAAAAPQGLLAPGQPPSAGGRRQPMRDPYLPRQLAVSIRMMELVVAACADTGADPVYAAGSDEGPRAFLILLVSAFPPMTPYERASLASSAARRSSRASGSVFGGDDSFQQLLQYASPGRVKWTRAYALIFSHAPGLHIAPVALPAWGLAGEPALASL